LSLIFSSVSLTSFNKSIIQRDVHDFFVRINVRDRTEDLNIRKSAEYVNTILGIEFSF